MKTLPIKCFSANIPLIYCKAILTLSIFFSTFGLVYGQCTDTPEMMVYALTTSCTDDIPNDDGYLQISAATNATHYDFSMGESYIGGGFGSATAFNPSTDLPLQFGTLVNPVDSQVYIIRVFNGADDCFTDARVVLKEQDCVVSCDCKEYIYLNEPDIGAVLKFEISEDTLLTEVLGINTGVAPTEHWYPGTGNSELPSPHGLATDLNGFLYIGSNFNPNTPIRKFSCDGTIYPIDSTTIIHPYILTSMFSIENTLYTTRSGGPASFDLCTGAELGTMCFNDTLGNPLPFVNIVNKENINWGLHYNSTIEMVYATGMGSSRQGIWAFTKEQLEAGINGGDCIDPLIWRSESVTFNNLTIGDLFLPSDIFLLVGITTDNDGNIYVAGSLSDDSGFALKYDANGGLLAVTDLNNLFVKTRGIVWSENYDRIYIANQTDNSSVDCISVFETDSLNYIGTGAPNPNLPGNNGAKALSILKECCPTSNRQLIERVYCVVGEENKIFLNQLYPCEGIICEGMWIPADAASEAVFDACDQSLTVTENGCYNFAKESDGAGINNQCGAFRLEFNLEIINRPEISLTADTTICEGGSITLATTTTADSYQWQIATDSCTGVWTDITGATSATYTTMALTDTTYFRVVLNIDGDCDAGSCPFESDCITLTPDFDCYDISLTKSVDNATSAIGSTVVFTIVVENELSPVSNAIVNEILPSGLTYAGIYSATTGTYDGTNWTVGNMTAGQIDSIQITAEVIADGVITNYASVSIDEQESNLINNEDKVCVSVPIQTCVGEPIDIDLVAETGFTNYQWYKDGIAIATETTQIYNATEIGSYTYTVDGAGPTGDCMGELCCPIIIEQISCCEPIKCLPVTITKLN